MGDMTYSTTPTLRTERELLRSGYTLVAGVDEVGRGSLAGPVSVGVAVVSAATKTVPVGVKDSKLVPELRRPALADAVRKWMVDGAVGHASPSEIDALGMTRALRLAGNRALEQLRSRPDVVILDGKHNWLSDPEAGGLLGLLTDEPQPDVVTMIKADMRCSSVAAASLLAKVERDGMMSELAQRYPHYQWDVNKGYSAPAHLAAIDEYGAVDVHRRSWKIFQSAKDEAGQ